jgi:hypothetical protein
MSRIKMDAPCPTCGAEYGGHWIDTSDEDAEELPVVLRCVRGHKIAVVPGQSPGHDPKSSEVSA